MATGPADILRLSEKEKEIKAKIVERVDSYLKKNFAGEPVEYPLGELKELGEIREAVLVEIIGEYKRSGWTNIRISEKDYPYRKRGKKDRYIHFEYVSPEEIKMRQEEKARLGEEYLKRDIEDSELNPTIIMPLKNAGISKTEELTSYTRAGLFKIGRIGRKRASIIQEKLREYGLDLKKE
jgi:hypothetical protein